MMGPPLEVSCYNGSTYTGADRTDDDSNPSTFESDTVAAPSLIDTASAPVIKVDSTDSPAVVWTEGGFFFPYEVKYSRWTTDTYTGADRIDSDGNPATYDADLLVSGSSDGSTNLAASLALNPSDGPGVTWTRIDGGSYHIMFTQWLEPCSSPASVQSLTIDSTDEPILNATLTLDEILLGGDVTLYLSNNGGSSFEEVGNGANHTFSTAGSDLKWKIDIASLAGAPGSCPLIDNLSVTYSTKAVPRVDGDNPSELAIAVSKQSFGDGEASNAVLARNNLLIDAFDSIPLVSLTNASLLLTDSDTLTPATLAEIQRVLAPGGRIYVLGGTEAISPAVVDALAANGFTTIERLGGARRYETAIAIYNKIKALNPGATTKALLTEAQFLVDALGVGHAAGNTSLNAGNVRPILLTERGTTTLNTSTQGHLQAESDLTELEIIGGEVAISGAVESQLNAEFAAISTPRIAGQTRYHTNQLTNDKYFSDPTIAVVANGEGPNIPGSVAPTSSGPEATLEGSGLFTALLGGSFAARFSAPLVLTQAIELPAPSLSYLSDHLDSLTTVYLIGGELDISSAVADLISSLF